MSDTEQEGFKPPYMSFQTFWTYIADLGTKPLPPTIDRSMMTGKSGTDQANLLVTLKGFDLIDENGDVLPALHALVKAEPDERKAILGGMVRQYYPVPLRVSEAHGTEAQLQEAFRAAYNLDAPETRRKSITFFVHAAKEADIALSANFKSARQPRGTGTPRRATTRKPRNPGGGGGAGDTTPRTFAPTPAGQTHSITLQSGGTVSVVVDVNLFTLSADDRQFVIDLVEKLAGYKQPAAASAGG